MGERRDSLLALLGRHQVGALAATVVDFGTMTLLVAGLGANAEIGTALGATLGGICNFTLGRHWIFGSSSAPRLGQASRYAAVSGGSLLLNTLGEYLLHERLGLQYLLARLVVAFVVSVLWNFPMQRHVVFSHPKSSYAHAD